MSSGQYRELSPTRRGPNSSIASESSTAGMVEISLGSSTDSLPETQPRSMLLSATTIHEDQEPLPMSLSHTTTPTASRSSTSPGSRLLSPSINGAGNANHITSNGASSNIISPRLNQTPMQSSPLHRDHQLARSIGGLSASIDPAMIPHIVRFLDIHDLYSCLMLSWLWFRAAVAQLYSRLSFSQLSGKRLRLVLHTLQNSVIRMAAVASGQMPSTSVNLACSSIQSMSMTTPSHPSLTESTPASRSQTSPVVAASSKAQPLPLMEYHMFVKAISISQIVFEEPAQTPLQSWYQVRDLLGLCAPTLESLSLAIGDDSFMDLPQDYVYLHAQISFPHLAHLRVTSRCQRLPEKLILELFRAAPIQGLVTIDLLRCLPNLSATGWFLLSERGGQALTRLILTPAMGPNMLGWDENLFASGLEQIARACPSLNHLDLSGHSQGISDQTLFLLLAHARDMQTVHLPCGLSDAHLVALLTNEPWPHLKVMGITCHCVDGEIREKRPPPKGGMSCNRFTDGVMLALLDHLASSLSETAVDTLEVHLPVYALSVKTSKRVTTIEWLAGLDASKRTGPESVIYKNQIRVLTPTNRLPTWH
ncbi:hypothetical protein BASA50_000054 [Batrachochytrium salamandrivorans]|uniref:F-box domain-containing protein n=1 Tax=Batrachochytrium salamandrivorans TaxID=1357716 RepID=A0ABQ8EUX2_9FUNG|nr:hypothetical protein BASA50_000054 [Batrachochytrium salamandrivorans]KAH6601268.1 hypothetical protein BASA61_002038 [Batrachochytrium salamandrivorans]KAH9271580.1 hypothetical protein BASA83_006189 [Batrachochytrium salamandrivorans]